MHVSTNASLGLRQGNRCDSYTADKHISNLSLVHIWTSVFGGKTIRKQALLSAAVRSDARLGQREAVSVCFDLDKGGNINTAAFKDSSLLCFISEEVWT